MKLILFALPTEVAPTLQKLKATPFGEETLVWNNQSFPSCYRFSKGLIVLTGLGSQNSTLSVMRYGQEADEILNIGICASLKKRPIGTRVPIASVDKFVALHTPLDAPASAMMELSLPKHTLREEGCSLISSDFPIHTSHYTSLIKDHHELLDMEGYGIASAAQALEKPCRMWKVVSDFATPGGRSLILNNLPSLAESMATFMTEEILS